MMDLLQWFFSSQFFLQDWCFVNSESRAIHPVPQKAQIVQGFWSKRVADTEEDKDSLRFFREELIRAAGEFLFGVVSTPGFAGVVFWGKATVKHNDVCNDMTILHDNTWWIVMQCDEIWNMMWCHVMGLKMIWYDVRSVPVRVKLANYKYTGAHHHSTMTGTSGFLAQLRLWKRIFPMTRDLPSGR